MAHFFSTIKTIKRRDRKQILKDLTSLDMAILNRAGETGASYGSILHACRPYKNKKGYKFNATIEDITRHIEALKKDGLLEIR